MQPSEKYKNESTAKYYDVVGKYYAETEGPYLLGDKATYADFAIYQIMDNDRRTGTIVVCLFFLSIILFEGMCEESLLFFVD